MFSVRTLNQLVEQLADSMVAEQLFNMLSPSVKEFVLSKPSETSEQIAAEADFLLSMHKGQ